MSKLILASQLLQESKHSLPTYFDVFVGASNIVGVQEQWLN
jgi:hypothetical protein